MSLNNNCLGTTSGCGPEVLCTTDGNDQNWSLIHWEHI